jgi:hypothetical protein
MNPIMIALLAESIAKPFQRPEGPEANRPGREAGIR